MDCAMHNSICRRLIAVALAVVGFSVAARAGYDVEIRNGSEEPVVWTVDSSSLFVPAGASWKWSGPTGAVQVADTNGASLYAGAVSGSHGALRLTVCRDLGVVAEDKYSETVLIWWGFGLTFGACGFGWCLRIANLVGRDSPDL